MGQHRDAVLSDITVVIRAEFVGSFKDVIEQLNILGVGISNVNEEVGVVEGTMDQTKVHGLNHLPFVQAVRTTFSYVADYPVGDPRDLDGPEPDDD